MLDLATQEDIRFKKLMSCKTGPSSADEIIQSVREGAEVITDDCKLYEQKAPRGVPISTYK